MIIIVCILLAESADFGANLDSVLLCDTQKLVSHLHGVRYGMLGTKSYCRQANPALLL